MFEAEKGNHKKHYCHKKKKKFLQKITFLFLTKVPTLFPNKTWKKCKCDNLVFAANAAEFSWIITRTRYIYIILHFILYFSRPFSSRSGSFCDRSCPFRSVCGRSARSTF